MDINKENQLGVMILNDFHGRNDIVSAWEIKDENRRIIQRVDGRYEEWIDGKVKVMSKKRVESWEALIGFRGLK